VSEERAAQRQRGRGKMGREKGGGPGRGGATWRGCAVGPGPDRRSSPGSGPSAALAASARADRTERGERGLTGGSWHNAGQRCH
jgi:hypothetical protein